MVDIGIAYFGCVPLYRMGLVGGEEMTQENESLKEKISKEANGMRQTLKARIIPNLPFSKEATQSRDCEIRDWVRDKIDEFEFEYYLQTTAEEIFKRIEKIGFVMFPSEDICITKKDWEQLKKEFEK